MLIDDVEIKINAGHGGAGRVAFNKNLKSLGPVGGSGGRGGSVYADGVSDLLALSQFRTKKEFSAENGEDGRGQFRDGKDGNNLVLKLPVGTVAKNLASGMEINIEKVGERVLLASGGIGGKGNFQFRSPRNTSPLESQPGLPGERFSFRLLLKFIADVGFVGLPNVGKSSLLNSLTNAESKVANYPFTTLEPNLGAYYELILADIPGLIEGSSAGRGLGIKFLRHIERTRILFHFISAESPAPLRDYKTIRKELGNYNEALLKKPERIFLTKSDLAAPRELKEKLSEIKKMDPRAIAISIHDSESIKKLEKILNAIKAEK
ncbi:Obg family GTPase CgtA [Candidatus Giovannonibacteria bacterium RIFCSPLOWO2_02_FULL_45_28]|uniref:GTPase Obg n=2 Tax=Candidatus Giovannoniibacteriota TaxID=1752738 RepID=A0A1F5WCJ2_9BACT|nr:MAG: GTPase obg [Parcubacteria group bacterium GW2011_GWC1_44_10]KKT60265.1 MAG: GTPase obg [Candidatus Giovannonibacteria bacterium GW2011_GWA1_44_25]KKU29166.1 MAG: GTPase obg [Candidatus Giovannonibacteria bacterium GW2011_GWB1_46_20]OGF49009.1 MAG: Obg family GTPase CgtA [Candidatus Giovannonibacteria bacterium GWA2_45_15]OGF59043.1 MAG: Obg family GTPase CgtA [Candidatus Giovannonibacteria bacterium RIFCSPHIGHO2_01_45_12]OGF72991.1 MAG: Obg family GTPase CgtA [Candidatus Giovannonibact